MIFTATVILPAVHNGRFTSTMNWQIIAPALVTSLSDVFFITGSFFFLGNSLQQPGICHRPCHFPCGTCCQRLFCSHAIFTTPFCMWCNERMNSLFLTTPKTGSFQGKNVGTFSRKRSPFRPLVQKLQRELPNLHLKKYRSRQLAFLPTLPPPARNLTRPLVNLAYKRISRSDDIVETVIF